MGEIGRLSFIVYVGVKVNFGRVMDVLVLGRKWRRKGEVLTCFDNGYIRNIKRWGNGFCFKKRSFGEKF